MDVNEQRIADGIQCAEFIWWSLAKRIMGIAGNLYKWDDERWRDMSEIFLRPNDYKVELS
jgi:hypothetical protein